MSDAARKKATYDELLRLPDNVIGEIIAGELVASPRPAWPHAHATSTLGMDLGGPFQRGRGGPGGWWIVDEPELHLGQHVLVPDLAGWRRERMPEPPGDVPFCSLAPDWICEILSPRSAGSDRVLKLPIYGEEGVNWAWLVDPSQRTLEAYRREGDKWLLLSSHIDAELAHIEPFAAVALEVGALWLGANPAPG